MSRPTAKIIQINPNPQAHGDPVIEPAPEGEEELVAIYRDLNPVDREFVLSVALAMLYRQREGGET